MNKHSLYNNVFTTLEGKEVLEDLKAELDKPYLHCKDDPYQTAFNVGKRDAYIYIVEQIESNYNGTS